MVNETITQGLKPYLIGEKIRALRLKKSMGLVELGKHTVFQQRCFQRSSAAN